MKLIRIIPKDNELCNIRLSIVSKENGNDFSNHAKIRESVLIKRKREKNEFILNIRDIAIPRREECDKVSPKDDIRLHTINEPNGAVVKERTIPANHPKKNILNI